MASRQMASLRPIPHYLPNIAAISQAITIQPTPTS